MSASNDSKVVVRDRSDNRAIWVRPTLRRLAANKAESGTSCINDGMGGGGQCTVPSKSIPDCAVVKWLLFQVPFSA